MKRTNYCSTMKLILAIVLLLLGLTPGISSAVDHKYSIPVPGTDAEVKFTSVYNLEQSGNIFYTLEGDAAIVFKFGVNRGDNFFLDWSTKKNVLSRASEKASPARYVRESPHNYDYMRGYIPVGTYTNMYGDPVMAYMEAGMVYGSKAYKGKNITFTMEVIDLDGIGRTLESAWISIPPTSEEKQRQLDPVYWNEVIQKYYNNGYFKGVVEASDNAIRLDPNNATTWYNKGYALCELKKFDEAINAYDEAIRLDAENVNAWINKGNALIERSNYTDAIKTFDKVIKIKPTLEPAWYNKGNALYHRRNYGESINAYNEGIRLNPNDAYAWNNKGNALYCQGNYDDALKAFNESINLDPQLAEAWNGKGSVLYEQKKAIMNP